MKALITIAIVLVLLFTAKGLMKMYEESKRAEFERVVQETPPTEFRPENLPGLPRSLEGSLEAAQKAGAPALKKWLQQYRAYVHDPRLAWIELDYVLLASWADPKEAKQVFRQVQQRTPPSSPVYERIKKLEKTYN